MEQNLAPALLQALANRECRYTANPPLPSNTIRESSGGACAFVEAPRLKREVYVRSIASRSVAATAKSKTGDYQVCSKATGLA
jgi:hypothetical protein